METNPQLLPAKIGGDVNRIEEDDVMIYEPVHPVIEITDSDDETSVPNAGGIIILILPLQIVKKLVTYIAVVLIDLHWEF